MEIQRLAGPEWQRLKRIRLAALRNAPRAFGSSLEVAQRWSHEDWRQQVEDLPTFLVTIDGADVGMVRGATDGSDTDAYLISMWVAPEIRGRGVGEKRVTAVVEWARDSGFSRLLLDVADHNSAAIALYQRTGFRPTGESGAYPPPNSHITEHRRARML